MKDFKQYFKLKASVEDVYNALTKKEMIEIWTGEPAVMSTEPGSAFELFDGNITGTNVEFELNKKLVQEWDFGDTDTPSVVTILVHDRKSKTTVELRHTNIPDDAYENIVAGWQEDYFGALEALFNE